MTNVFALIGATISFFTAYLTGTGKILQIISFADPLNEMGFFIACIMLGTCCLFSIETKKNC